MHAPTTLGKIARTEMCMMCESRRLYLQDRAREFAMIESFFSRNKNIPPSTTGQREKNVFGCRTLHHIRRITTPPYLPTQLLKMFDTYTTTGTLAPPPLCLYTVVRGGYRRTDS